MRHERRPWPAVPQAKAESRKAGWKISHPPFRCGIGSSGAIVGNAQNRSSGFLQFPIFLSIHTGVLQDFIGANTKSHIGGLALWLAHSSTISDIFLPLFHHNFCK